MSLQWLLPPGESSSKHGWWSRLTGRPGKVAAEQQGASQYSGWRVKGAMVQYWPQQPGHRAHLNLFIYLFLDLSPPLALLAGTRSCSAPGGQEGKQCPWMEWWVMADCLSGVWDVTALGRSRLETRWKIMDESDRKLAVMLCFIHAVALRGKLELEMRQDGGV